MKADSYGHTYQVSRDQILIFLAAISFAVSFALFLDIKLGSLLSFRSNNYSQINQKDQIGKVLLIERDVRFRKNEDLVWAQAEENFVIKNGDGVFTGKRSTAILEINENQRIEIKPDSLIVFQNQKSEGRQIIEIKRGGFRGKVSANTKLKIGAKEMIATGTATIEIFNDVNAPEKSKISVIEGTLSVRNETSQETVKVGPAQGIEISATEKASIVKRVPFELTSPVDYDKIFINKISNEVSFKWNRLIDSSNSYDLLLSRDLSFSIVQKIPVEGERHVINISESGTWYWKLSLKKDDDNYITDSPAGRFDIIELSTPTLLHVENKKYYLNENQSPLKIPVSAISNQATVNPMIEISVVNTEFSQNEILQKELAREFSKIKVVKPGVYIVKIRNVIDSHVSAWSNELSFEILPPIIKTPEPTVLTSPTPALEIAQEAPVQKEQIIAELPKIAPSWQGADVSKAHVYIVPDSHNSATISWKKERNYFYKLQISQDNRFSTDLIESLAKDDKFEFTPSKPGLYYVRIRAEDEAGQSSTWHHFRSIEAIKTYPIEAKNYQTPIKDEEVFLGRKTEFSWQSQQDAEKYFLVLKQEGQQEVDNIIETADSKTRISLSSNRHYNWAVYYAPTAEAQTRKVASVDSGIAISVADGINFVSYEQKSRLAASLLFSQALLSQNGASTLKPASSLTLLSYKLEYSRNLFSKETSAGVSLTGTQYTSSAASQSAFTGKLFIETKRNISNLNTYYGFNLSTTPFPVVDVRANERILTTSELYIGQYFGVSYALRSSDTLDIQVLANERLSDVTSTWIVSPILAYNFNSKSKGSWGLTYAYRYQNVSIDLGGVADSGYVGTVSSTLNENCFGINYKFEY